MTFFEALQDDVLDFSWVLVVCPYIAEAPRRRADVVIASHVRVLTGVRQISGQQLEQDDTEAVKIGARRDRGAGDLLGRHVCRRAGAGQRLIDERTAGTPARRKAKIEDLEAGV